MKGITEWGVGKKDDMHDKATASVNEILDRHDYVLIGKDNLGDIRVITVTTPSNLVTYLDVFTDMMTEMLEKGLFEKYNKAAPECDS